MSWITDQFTRSENAVIAQGKGDPPYTAQKLHFGPVGPNPPPELFEAAVVNNVHKRNVLSFPAEPGKQITTYDFAKKLAAQWNKDAK